MTNRSTQFKGGNKAALKADSEKSSANITMRVHPEDKALIVRNLKHGETLTTFIMGLAVEEAKRREGGKPCP